MSARSALTRTALSDIHRGSFQQALSQRVEVMSRRCELTGVGPMVGHKVSHSNRKTKRRFEPNLCDVTLASDALGRAFRMRVTAAALRSVDHVGGLDNFLMKAREEALSLTARRIRRELRKKLGAGEGEAGASA